MTQVEL